MANHVSKNEAGLARQIEFFCRADSTPGPHPIPRSCEVKNELHSIFSIKAGMRDVTVESPLEADAFIFEEGQIDIVSLCEQSPRINGAILNRPYYTFDYSTRYLDTRTVHKEVKEDYKLELLDDGRRCPPGWLHIEAWCRTHGEQCAFITELDLEPHQQFITNWRTLLPFARAGYEDFDAALEKSILTHVSRAGRLTVAEVHAAEASSVTEHVMEHIAKLLHQGRLVADLHELPVSPITALSMQHQDANDATG
ncbi:MAG: hypothetical protein DBP01_11470 [gamma proteobacterium symbiont of Ctena orbiculata]|nr:MAG: hypothetical protein DBP01_11470 [gamma proteobacterium symbiont of Ctena orbiculata]